MKDTKAIGIAVAVLVLATAIAGCVGDPAYEESKTATHGAPKRTYEDGYEKGFKEAQEMYETKRVSLGARFDTRTVDVPKGDVAGFAINLTSEASLTYNVLQYAGPSFDIMVVDTQNLRNIETGQPFSQHDFCSDWYTTSIERTCQLPIGAWNLVIDNSPSGAATPKADEYGDDTLRLKVTYEVWRMQE